MQTSHRRDVKLQNRVVGLFALRRDLVLLLVTILLISTGEELWMRFLPKYLQTLGAAALIIGIFDALRTALGAIYAYPGGIFVDRWGHRRALALFTLLSIGGYALVALIPHWAAVIGGMFLFLSWSCFSLPASFSLVGATLAQDRHAMGIAVQSFVKRLPILAGPIMGGVLIDKLGVVRGVRSGLTISCALGLVALIVQMQIRDEPRIAGHVPQSFLAIAKQMNAPLRRLLLSDILIRFCERLPYAWIVIYAMDYVGVNATDVGLLTGLEMLAAMLCTIPAAHFADKYGREPFVVTTFLFFTLFPATLLFAHTFAFLAVAFLVRGLKEFGEPARKALIIGACPPATRGRMIGSYYLIRDLIVSTGALVGAALWKLGPRVNFGTAVGAGLAGTFFYLATTRRRTG